MMVLVRTSQMNVTRSCHGAFFGSNLRAAVVATTAMPATAAREYADVAVKTEGAWVVISFSVVLTFFSSQRHDFVKRR